MSRVALRTTLGRPLLVYAAPKPLDFKADTWLSPGELKGYRNPRNPVLDEEKIQHLMTQIPQNGIHRPVTVISDGSRALMDDGHHRTVAAGRLGLDRVPTEIFKVNRGFFDEDDPNDGAPLGPGLAQWWKSRSAAYFTEDEMRERGEQYMRDHPDWREEPGLKDWAQTLGYVDETPYLNAIWDEDLDDDDDEPDHLTLRRRVP